MDVEAEEEIFRDKRTPEETSDMIFATYTFIIKQKLSGKIDFFKVGSWKVWASVESGPLEGKKRRFAASLWN